MNGLRLLAVLLGFLLLMGGVGNASQIGDEASFIGGISDFNVVTIIQVGEHDGIPSLTMNHIMGVIPQVLEDKVNLELADFVAGWDSAVPIEYHREGGNKAGFSNSPSREWLSLGARDFEVFDLIAAQGHGMTFKPGRIFTTYELDIKLTPVVRFEYENLESAEFELQFLAPGIRRHNADSETSSLIWQLVPGVATQVYAKGWFINPRINLFQLGAGIVLMLLLVLWVGAVAKKNIHSRQ